MGGVRGGEVGGVRGSEGSEGWWVGVRGGEVGVRRW